MIQSVWGKIKSLTGYEWLAVLGSIASLIGLVAVFLPTKPGDGVSQSQSGGSNNTMINTSGSVIVSPPPSPGPPADWHLTSQSMRMAAESIRDIAQMHLPQPTPPAWNKAEKKYQDAVGQYDHQDFESAYASFKEAYVEYNDLLSTLKALGH
ncbi:hypothetical protein [Burkholderia ubonensis]|uniref:hypothetical protein n=2 Tax=Burkholderia ubonensis TaxID=101571 RepID=UPI000AD62225|nr:hypothetical protein [Burkholderia ubonensis]